MLALGNFSRIEIDRRWLRKRRREGIARRSLVPVLRAQVKTKILLLRLVRA
jgi:hypothetical protein